MRKSVISYLESSADKYTDKLAYVDEKTSITFGQLREAAQAIGSGLIPYVRIGDPVCVYMEKSVGATGADRVSDDVGSDISGALGRKGRDAAQ